MKYLKKYNLFESKSEDVSIYDADWKELLPQVIVKFYDQKT